MFGVWVHLNSNFIVDCSCGNTEMVLEEIWQDPKIKKISWLSAMLAQSLGQVARCHLLECQKALQWVQMHGTHPSTIPDSCLINMEPLELLHLQPSDGKRAALHRKCKNHPIVRLNECDEWIMGCIFTLSYWSPLLMLKSSQPLLLAQSATNFA